MSTDNGKLNGHTSRVEELEVENKALSVQLASIRSLCEAGWPRGEPCRLCNRVKTHSDVCYVRMSSGYDLLNEHEATLRENDELRMALAARLPAVNRDKLLSGERYLSLRSRLKGRFSKHDNE